MADSGVVARLEASGALRRVTAALIAEELGEARAKIVPTSERLAWEDSTRLDEEDLGADSLTRMRLASRLNAFFNLHESGVEDYLLVAPTVGEWCALIAEGLRRGSGRITFRTSGSTGEPRHISHAFADLLAEADGHGLILRDATRIMSLAPAHHIYGFLFSVLGPALRDMPVLDLSGAAPGASASRAEKGDALIATPFLWELICESGATLSAGTLGITSTAPCPPPLWTRVHAAGVDQLFEIYGSSETAGLGVRSGPDSPFTPLPHLRREGRCLHRRRDESTLAPPDHLEWSDDGFRPVGRRDGAVQVGGVNVFPRRVREFLCAQPGVEDCAVRLDGPEGTARLKAFIQGPTTLEPALRAAILAELTPPERPQKLSFGSALPRNAIGKLTDWDVRRAPATATDQHS